MSNTNLRLRREDLEIIRNEDLPFGSVYLYKDSPFHPGYFWRGLSPSRAKSILKPFDPKFWSNSIARNLIPILEEKYPHLDAEEILTDDVLNPIMDNMRDYAAAAGSRIHEELESPHSVGESLRNENELAVFHQLNAALKKLEVFDHRTYPELFMWGEIQADGFETLPIVCFADLISVNGSSYRVIDYKTKLKDCQKPSKDDHLIQALFLAICFRNLFGVSAPQVDFITATPNKYYVTSYTTEELHESVKRLGLIGRIFTQFGTPVQDLPRSPFV